MAQQKPRIVIELNYDKITDKVKKRKAENYKEQLKTEIKTLIGDKYHIYSRSEDEQKIIIAMHQFEKSGMVNDSEKRKEFGEQHKIDFVCSISVSWSEDSQKYYLYGSLIDIGSGRDVVPLGTYNRLRDEDDVSAAADSLARKLLDAADKRRVSGNISGTGNSSAASSSNVSGNTLTDSRDGEVYRTVKIGSLTWMAKNLNYNASGAKCYDNDNFNCKKYGRLYDWNTAMKACPSGWHLPSKAEWDDLYQAAGGKEVAGTKLKAKNGWNTGEGYIPGTDEFGFNALPGGFASFASMYKNGGFFSRVGDNGNWWSASENISDYTNYYHLSIDRASDGMFLSGSGFHFDWMSVRCVRD
jgi:uncharacterized protein (TIGR02145 family)